MALLLFLVQKQNQTRIPGVSAYQSEFYFGASRLARQALAAAGLILGEILNSPIYILNFKFFLLTLLAIVVSNCGLDYFKWSKV